MQLRIAGILAAALLAACGGADQPLDPEDTVSVADAQPADGTRMWRLPKIDSNRCKIRLEVTAPDGLQGVVESGRFTISSSTPEVRAGGIRPASDRE